MGMVTLKRTRNLGQRTLEECKEGRLCQLFLQVAEDCKGTVE